ncbi:hypothetical protein K458DRAFT_387034 [Lentithecium fluviatile CBS 122367]|uniref:Uncharacterized protein n=1 Tax=Lentithecium fluviatile CBS 122367 TaxID=1168545 RepID=A0A6G1J693_9PLEO|nr:hypothetical protein K458DRAFT_387034 [Lentithecium fluviatile CBS 122367]
MLVLEEVLHVPDGICNILGGQAMGDHSVSFSRSHKSMGDITLGSRQQVAYFQPGRPLLILDVAASPARTWIADVKYTEEEKAFLKAGFGGEFHFLRQYSLDIHN